MKTVYFDYYQKSDDFKAYVDRYCKKHGIEVAEALTHEIIKDVANLYLKEDEANAKIEAGTITPSAVCAYEMEDKSC